MDLHKLTFVGTLMVQDYSGDSDLLLVVEEPVALNNENDTAEENQPLSYRIEKAIGGKPSMFSTT